jgi:hypothetical protein
MPGDMLREAMTTGSGDLDAMITRQVQAGLAAAEAGGDATAAATAAAQAPWYTTIDPTTYAPEISTEALAVLKRLEDFEREVTEKTGELSKRQDELRAENEAELSAASGDFGLTIAATSKFMAEIGQILAELLVLAGKGMTITAMKYGVMKMIGSYPTDTLTRQTTISSFLAEIAGSLHAGDIDDFMERLPAEFNPDTRAAMRRVAGAQTLSPEFQIKLAQVASKHEINPQHLMAVMSFETGETFDPKISNNAGSGAVGLIQFTEIAAKQLNTTTEQLAKMDAIAQLDYVDKYFAQYDGKMRPGSLVDVYMAVLWPSAIGKSDTILFKQPSIQYQQNSGLDSNNDGKITAKEATQKVIEKILD